MPKLGDIVTYVTDQGQPRMAFVSAEVVELPEAEDESDEEKQAREQKEADEQERLDKAQAVRDELLAAQTEAARIAHEEAEARAGGPIQRVVMLPPEPVSPAPALPPVEEQEEEDVTGPELTLHVLLHSSDADASQYGLMATYAGVRHSEQARPHTWH